MKPSRPLNKGNKKFVKIISAQSNSYQTSTTGDLVIASGSEDAFIALSKVNITIGTEFLKTRDMQGAINISMTDHQGWIKGVALTQLADGGPLRLMPLSYQPYMRNIQISQEVAYGFHTEAITDSNDWYIKLIATDAIAGSTWAPFIYVGPDSAVLPPGDLDGDGLDDEEQAAIEEGITSGEIPATNPMPETPVQQMPPQMSPVPSNNRRSTNSQPSILELTLHRVADAAGNTIDINQRRLGVTYPEMLTFYLRTTRDSVIADEVYYHEDVDSNLIRDLVHPPAGPSGRVKQKMWVIENVEVTEDGDFSFLFTAEAAGYENSDVEVSISYGEEVIEETPTEGEGTGGSTGEGTGTGSETGGEAGTGSETGGGTGTGEGGGSVTPPQVTLITLDSITDNSDDSEVTGTLSAPSTITFSGTLDETVTSVYSSTGDAVTDNNDGTWTMTKQFTTDGVQSITFYATDGSETQSVVGSVTLQSEVSAAYVQPSPAPATPPADGGTIETNPEDPEALDVVGTSYVLENLTTDNPLVSIAIKIKLTEETPVFTFSDSNGSITVSATQVTASGRLFDSRQTVLFEDLNANFLNGEWLHLVMVFDKVWSGGYSGGGNYWRSYGAINGVTFEKVLEVNNEDSSFISRTNLFNDGTLTVGPGDFTFKHLEVIPGFAATPDQIAHFWNTDGYLYQSVATVAAGTTVEPIYDANLLQIDSAEYQNSAGVVEFDSGILTAGGGRKYKNGQAFEFFKMSPLYQNGKTWAAGLWIDTTNTSTAWHTIFAKHDSGGISADGWFVRARRDSNGLYQFSLFVTKNNAFSKNYMTAPIDIGDGYVSLLMKLKWELSDNLEVFVNDFSTPVFTTTVNKDYMARSQTFDFTDWPLGTLTTGTALFTVGENFYNAVNGKERLQGAISYLKGFHGVTDAGMDQQIYAEIQASIGEIVFPQVSINDDGLTNQENYTLTGTFVDCASITVDGVAATLNVDGTWSIDLTLVHGINNLEIIATGPTGLEETFSYDLEADLVSPIILLSKLNGQNAVSGDIIEVIQGEVYPYPTSDDGVSIVNSSGTLDTSILGDQTITYTCQDDAGNSAIPLTVTYRIASWQPQHLEDGEKNGNNWSVGPNSVDAIGNLWITAGGNNLSSFDNSDIYRYATRQTVYAWFKVDQPATNTGVIRIVGSSREGSQGNQGWNVRVRGLTKSGENAPYTGRQVVEFKSRSNTNIFFETKDSQGNVIDPRDGNWHNIIVSWTNEQGSQDIKCWFDGVEQSRDANDSGALVGEPNANVANLPSIYVGQQNYYGYQRTEGYGIDAVSITNDYIDDSTAIARYNAYKPMQVLELDGTTLNKENFLGLAYDSTISSVARFTDYLGQEVTLTNDPSYTGGGFSYEDLTFSNGQSRAVYINSVGIWMEESTAYVEGSSKLFLDENGVMINSSLNDGETAIITKSIAYGSEIATIQNDTISVSFWFKYDGDPSTPQSFYAFRSGTFQTMPIGMIVHSGNKLQAYQVTNANSTVDINYSNQLTDMGINLFDGQWHHVYTSVAKNYKLAGFIGNSLHTVIDGAFESIHDISGVVDKILQNSPLDLASIILGDNGKDFSIDSFSVVTGIGLTFEQAQYIHQNGRQTSIYDAQAGVPVDLESGYVEIADLDGDPMSTDTSSIPWPTAIEKGEIVISNSFFRPSITGVYREKAISFWAIINGDGDVFALQMNDPSNPTRRANAVGYRDSSWGWIYVNKGSNILRLDFHMGFERSGSTNNYHRQNVSHSIDLTTNPINSNTPYHFMFVFGQPSNNLMPVRFYMNGVEVATANFQTNKVISLKGWPIHFYTGENSAAYAPRAYAGIVDQSAVDEIYALGPQDTTAPTIYLHDQDGVEITETSITIYEDDPNFTITATASDLSSVSNVGDVLDVTTAGTYNMVFQATDYYGNIGTRTIEVINVANDNTLFGDIYHRSLINVDTSTANLDSISYLNQILTFDGTGYLVDDRVDYLHNLFFSFSFWFKFQGDPNLDPTQSYGVWCINGFAGGDPQGGLDFKMTNTAMVITTDQSRVIQHTFDSPVLDDTWHHVAYTYDEGLTKLYFDGNLVGEITGGNLWATKSLGLTLGARRRAGGQLNSSFPNFIGQLSNGFIYDSVLSPDNVSNLYSAGLTGDATPIEISSITLNGQDALDYTTPVIVNVGDDLSGLVITTNKETFTADATTIDTSTDVYRDFYRIEVVDSNGFTDYRNIYVEVGSPTPIEYIEEMPSLITYDSGDAATQTYVEGTTNAFLNGLNQLQITSTGFARTSTKEVGQIDGEKTISFWVRFDNALPNDFTWVLSKLDADRTISSNMRGWRVGFRQTNGGGSGRPATTYINQNGYVENGYLVFSSGNSNIPQRWYRFLIFKLNTPFQPNELMHFAIHVANVGEGLTPKLKVYHDGVLITEAIQIGDNYNSYVQLDAEGWLHTQGEIYPNVDAPLTIGRFIEEEVYPSTVGQFNGSINDLKISDGLTSEQDIYNEGSRTAIQQITFDGQIIYEPSTGTDLLDNFYTIPLNANPEDHISFTTIATTTSNISDIDTSVEGGIHFDFIATNAYDGDNSQPKTLRLIIGNPTYNGLEDLLSLSLAGQAAITSNNTLSFDGNGDYAILSHHRHYDLTESKTISLWFKTSALKTGTNQLSTLLGKWNYTNKYGFAAYVTKGITNNTTMNTTISSLNATEHGYLRMVIGDDASNPGNASSTLFKFHRDVEDNLWHNLVIQVDNVVENTQPKVRAYLDGALMDGRNHSNGLPDIEGWVTNNDNVSLLNEGADLFIGAVNNATNFFSGEIDGIWFESGIKDPALIQQEGSAYQIDSITIGGTVIYDPSQSINLLSEIHNIPLNEDPETYIQISTGAVMTNNLSDINTAVNSGLSFDIVVTDEFGRDHDSKTVLLTIGSHQSNGIEDLSPSTLIGSATLLGGVLDVATDSDYMIKPHQTIYDIDQAKTVSFWFNKSSLETTNDRHHNALSKWNTSGDGYGYGMALSAAGTSNSLSNTKLTTDDYLTNGYFRLYMVNAPSTNHASNSSFFKFNKSVTDSQWHQIVIQFDNVAVGQQPLVRVFLDGAVLTEGFGYSNNSTLSTISNGWVTHRFYPEPSMPNNDLLIGQQANLSWRGFKGQLDGVNYENGIVDEATILNRYNAGR